MKAITAYLFIGVVLVFCIRSTAQEREPAKGNVRYVVHPDYSRFLLFFKGPLAYTQELKDNCLTISFSEIKSTAAHSGWSRKFRTGQIESATVSPVVSGKSTVVLKLRRGYKNYRLVEHDRHEAIWVDVYSASTGSAVSVSSPLQSKQTAQKSGASMTAKIDSKNSKVQPMPEQTHPEGQTPIIDIAALVRQQIDQSEAVVPQLTQSTQSNQTHSAPVGLPSSGRWGQSPFLLVIALLLLAISVSVMIVLVLRALKKGRQLLLSSPRVTGAVSQKSDQAQAQDDGRSVLLDRLQESLSAENNKPEPMQEDDAIPISLAEKYRRNQGDVDLALKLRENAMHRTHLGVAKTIRASSTPVKSTAFAAKKLGVGKGELDLASRLLKMSVSQSETESKE